MSGIPSTQDVSFLEMSDEDVMKLSGPEAVAPAEEPAAATPAAETTEEPAPQAAAAAEVPADTQAADAAEDAEDKAGTEPAPAAEQAAEPAGAGTAPEAGESGEAKPETQETETKAIDYEAEYKKLLAPFKANGREIKVESVDDAINLMQMGANYNKKMAALKPNLKLMKMLENNGLLSEEKLSFLIDLDKKNPAAINKLVKDSGIDPMEIDAEKAGAYKQPTYAVDDREIELDTVLDEIKDSTTYTRTLEVVGNKWDGASKQVIAQTPQLLKVINDHMASGIYDLISTEIERERMFGRLTGMSDIDAYRAVGDAIQARGGFNHLFQKNQAAGSGSGQGQMTPPVAKPVTVPPKPKVDASNLNDKRRAAGSTQSTVTTSAVPKDFNPLSMSDEEFSKLSSLKFR